MADRKVLFRSGANVNEASPSADRLRATGLLSGAATVSLENSGGQTATLSATQFILSGTVELNSASGGNITGFANIGGKTISDLVEKDVAETIAGVWTFQRSAGDGASLIAKARSGQAANSSIFEVQDSAGAVLMKVDVEGDLTVQGTQTFVGGTTFEGNTTLGNQTSDTITFSGRVNSDIDPSVDNSFDLGDSAGPLRWRSGYFSTSLVLGTSSVNLSMSSTALTSSGQALTVDAGNGAVDSAGHALTMTPGDGGAASATSGGTGGAANLTGGTGGAGTATLVAGPGGAVVITGGGAGANNGGGGAGGGNVTIDGGASTGAGAAGKVVLSGTRGNIEMGNATTNPTITQVGTGQVTFTGNVDATAGLDVSGGALTVANQAITQTTGGQVTFAGNVDANGGLDVSGANLTVASGIHIRPAADNASDLGATGLGFANLWLRTVGGSATVNLRASGAGADGALAIGYDPTGRTNITATNVSDALDELDNAVATASQIVISFTAGEAIGAGDAVRISANDTVLKAIATSEAAAQVVGVAEAAISNAATGDVTTGYGSLIQSAKFVGGLTLAANDIVYLSAATAGSLTNVAPSTSGQVVKKVGVLKDATGYDGTTVLTAEIVLQPEPGTLIA